MIERFCLPAGNAGIFKLPTRRLAGLFFVPTMLFSQALLAQTGKDDDTLGLLEQENQVFAASRYMQSVSETPANVTVITRDDIRRYGYRDIAAALKSIPGIYSAASQWPATGVRGFAVPGDFGSRILYLVNGMPIYEPTYGGFFIEQLDIDTIDRIEFVKGSGSALYGSGAVLGVVNLITRTGRDAAGKTASLEAASHDKRKAYVSWGKANAGGTNAFVSASIEAGRGRDIYLKELDTPEFDSDRYHGISADNDRSNTVRVFGRLTHEDAWVQGLFVGAHQRDPLASYGTVLNGRLMLRETLGGLETGIKHDMDDGAVTTARAYAFSVSEQGDYPYTFAGARVPPVDFINVTDLASFQYGGELRYDRFISGNHHLLAGAEIKRVASYQQVGDQPGPVRSGVVTVNESPGYEQWAVFAQDEMKAGPGKLFVGLRYDAYRDFSEGVKSHLSPRLVYVQDFSYATTGKLIYGEAYRAPTIYESRFQDGEPAAETLWANPNLKPEIARSMEALLEHESRPGTKWRLSAFVTRLADTPVLVPTPEYNGVLCDLGPDSCNQYRNSASTQQVSGIEADVRIRQANRDSAYASVTLQQSRQDGEELASSPRYLLKAGASRALPWPGIDAAVETRYVGSVQGLLNQDGSRTAEAPSFVMLDAALNISRSNWRISLRADNLFNRQFYTVASRELQPLQLVPADGRHYSLQYQLDF